MDANANSLDQTIGELISKAKAAQAVYATFSQKQYDKITRICAKTVYDNAEMLAIEAVNETGMGTVESKVLKQQNAAKNQWYYSKGKKSKGVVGWEKGKLDKDCILKLAKPIGVIGSITPSTNPTATMVSNSIQAFKTGNAIIFCPHPRAMNVSIHCAQLIRDAIVSLGAPADLIQVPENPSLELTNALIRKVDVVVATGGAGMVESAYSSGKPCLGVGQGNCQVCVDKGMEDSFDFMTAGAVKNRSYDCGIPCTGEQTIIIPECDKDAILEAFDRNGAMVISDDKIVDKIRKELFTYSDKLGDYMINRDYVGMQAPALGKALGFDVPEDKKVIVFKLSGYGEKELLCREKLCPVIGYITYSGDWEECVNIAKTNLLIEGAGHSSDIYTKSEDKQIYAGTELPVCRLIVNNSNSVMGGNPYFNNGMVPTNGVGCGYWGGNSISENLSFVHLLNYTRMFYTIEGREPPTEEEIWGEED